MPHYRGAQCHPCPKLPANDLKLVHLYGPIVLQISDDFKRHPFCRADVAFHPSKVANFGVERLVYEYVGALEVSVQAWVGLVLMALSIPLAIPSATFVMTGHDQKSFHGQKRFLVMICHHEGSGGSR